MTRYKEESNNHKYMWKKTTLKQKSKKKNQANQQKKYISSTTYIWKLFFFFWTQQQQIFDKKYFDFTNKKQSDFVGESSLSFFDYYTDILVFYISQIFFFWFPFWPCIIIIIVITINNLKGSNTLTTHVCMYSCVCVFMWTFF